MTSGERVTRNQTRTWPLRVVSAEEAGFVLPARWQPARRLGGGGQADVWLAQDTELKEWVAIKVFHPDLSAGERERMRREVSLGRSLAHPNLVRVYELIDAGDRAAVVMEWVSEGSLAQRLDGGPLPIEDVVRIADDALAALAFLHERNIVHRDVKPSNLLLDADGRARLADLGLVRRIDDAGDLTRTAMTVGTPMYMSPEQLRGEKAGPPADLYGLGVTLFQLLTGRAPFQASSQFEVARLHMQARVPDPRQARPDCPRWLGRFVARLLEKAPADRFADAREARAALLRQRVVWSPRTRRRLLTLATGLLVVGAAAGAVVELVVPALRRGETVKVEAVASRIRGLDGHGRTTWSATTLLPIRQVEHADLDGDGVPETVVATEYAGQESVFGSLHPEVLIVARSGRVITRLHPEEVIANRWPYEYPLRLTPILKLVDLDGDGRPEVLANCRHVTFFPTLLLVYWPQTDSWQPVLLHSGSLYDVAAVPGARPPRLRVAGINNRLSMLPVVGELTVESPGSAARVGIDEPTTVASADLGPGDGNGVAWNWYTLLDEGAGASSLSIEPDGSSRVLCGTRAVTVDRFGNLVPGPNAGLDLRDARRRLWDRLRELGPGSQPMNRNGVARRIQEAEAAEPHLLAEAPFRAVLGLAGARAYARVGALDAATSLLESTLATGNFEDLVFRLSHLRALAGDLEGAVSALLPGIDEPRTPRATYDSLHLLFRLQIERKDESAASAVLDKLGGRGGFSRRLEIDLVATLWARAHLWWDRINDGDCAVHAVTYAPDGEAIACLARWRAGQTGPNDPAAMESAIETHPDAAWEGKLAWSAAQLSLGHPREAVEALETLLPTLEQQSRDDFMNRQVLDLGRGLYVQALWQAGEHDRALREARAIRPLLRDGLLPAVLADKVLSGAGAR